MKFASFPIIIFIYSMGGVIYLFSDTDIYAQNNARREFKFYQENIRSKKKNNELQKLIKKNKRIKKSENKFRIRVLFLYQNESEIDGIKEGYYYKENDYPAYFSLEIIYNNFGISKSTYKRFYEFYYPERELFYQWYEKYSLDSINISYMFGEDLTFTIGRSIRLVNGDAEKWNWNEDGSGYVHSSTNYSGHINFITLGYRISIFEILMDLRDVSDVRFDNFECSSGNCGDHEMFRKEPIKLKNTLNFGFGFVF